MPLRALVDTNVMVDLLSRAPWFGQAKPLWDARDAFHATHTRRCIASQLDGPARRIA